LDVIIIVSIGSQRTYGRKPGREKPQKFFKVGFTDDGIGDIIGTSTGGKTPNEGPVKARRDL